MIQTSNKILTLEEFLALPETKPYCEYIDGKIIPKPMPQGKHSTIQGELCPTINSVVKVQKMGWAFPELRCTYPSGSRASHVYAGRSIVPDVAVFCWARLPVDENGDIANIFAVAPDWIIEILSRTKPYKSYKKNLTRSQSRDSNGLVN